MSIPQHLVTTVRLIQCAFPKGIDEVSYLILIKILSEEMSDRNLADCISYCSEKNLSEVMNDVYKARCADYSHQDISKVLHKLEGCGYNEWLEEE
ncbi:hypothetical protein QT397_12850 [Microbulbifer sp. MKSA007]|nr:hypothetical protein QT397_12850 [Microbulbifer sp. MKSA007]